MKFNWKLKKGGSLSFFAIGGASDIAIVISSDSTYSEEVFGEGDRDQDFGTAMGVAGFTLKKPLNERTYITSTVAFSHLIFNISGTILLWPFKKLPILLARNFAEYSTRNKLIPVAYVLVLFFLIPLLIIFIFN